jgi:hypothetical protein
VPTQASRGEAAERLVVDRLRSVLPAETAVVGNVRWLVRDHGTEREGEADVVASRARQHLVVIGPRAVLDVIRGEAS